MTIPAIVPSLPRILNRFGSISLWLLATLHLLVLASLLLVLATISPAAAAEACSGKNLLAALKRDDPQRYAQVVEEAGKIANGEGTFWRIEREGTAPSYLLGTMHVADPRVLAMPAGAAEAHAKARMIVIESDEILDQKKAAAALFAKPELTMFTDGRSMESLLSADDLAVLEAGLKKRGLVLSAVSRMKPWMLAGFVAKPLCETDLTTEGVAFLDKKIALDAITAGKPVKGLETLAEQLEAMARLPIEFHLQALVETIRLGDRMNDVVETMTQLYLAGQTGLTMPAMKALTPSASGGDESTYAAFESAVISERNIRMAERAAPLLAEGGVFIAVGALHLPGEKGLVELFRKQGFEVTRVQ
ncbi:MAG TPA: TraB/GumN family protein [Pseudorhizobium sp.]|nr:TraB/GumN family protein [Pseudorhizobium sp.]